MSDNKNHKNPVSELPSSTTTTTTGNVQHHRHHQQQQIYQVTSQPPPPIQQHPQQFTSGYVKNKSNSLNINVKQVKKSQNISQVGNICHVLKWMMIFMILFLT